jgi:hypothetical protein
VAPKLVVEPLALQTYKRKRTISLQWTGGYTNDKLNVELYKNKKFDRSVAKSMENKTALEWKMPRGVKGRHYTLRITNAARPNEMAESVPFRVKAKVPFLIKVLPILAAGGVAAFLSGSSDTDPGGGDESLPILPGPTKPN